MQSTRKITGQALEELAEYLPDQLEKIAQGLLLANPTGFEREDPVFWKGGKPDGRQWKRADGSPVYLQSSRDGCWIAPGKLPPYGLVAIQTSEKKADPFPGEGVTAGKNTLENSLIRVEFNPAGDITRVFDKQNQREVLPAGQIANQFQAFEDRPNYWDAWDIEKSFDDRVWLSEPADKIEVVETGPLVGTIEITRRILHSTYTQRISLAFNSSRVEFDTVVHWDEKHILLKTAFPVEVFSPYATYEIQWGNIQRPTHSNTSWDWARFETCGHKWVDLSEGGYGVSLLNDCKYGHDIQGQVMRISLLRSSTDPDPHADEGLHHFNYFLYPHDGGWDERTIAAAYGVNDPVLVQPLNNQKMVQDYSLIRADQANVVIETIKLAEDGDGMIIRLYECQRRRGKVTLQTGNPVQKAWLCDLLENRLHELPVVDGKIELFRTPYQIATLRLVFAASERG
jgi:alpha-mannosidase